MKEGETLRSPVKRKSMVIHTSAHCSCIHTYMYIHVYTCYVALFILCIQFYYVYSQYIGSVICRECGLLFLR